MKRAETFIRTLELGLALASTYMTAVTLLKTSLYVKLKPLLLTLLGRGENMMGWFRIGLVYFDLSILILVMLLSLLCWRRGDEAGFGRLFSLNMLMFFPSVIDFSMFNWVNLIMPYDPAPSFSRLRVFGVGLLLQVTYIALMNTVRFRGTREELVGRGANSEDVDDISKGQMTYLAILMTGTAAVVTSIYYATPVVKVLIVFEIKNLPYPHVVIGIVCSILIAVATIIYLKGLRTQAGYEPEEQILEETKAADS